MNWEHIFSLLYRSLQETFLMVTMSTFFASILGMILGIIINNTSKHGITPNKIVHKILDIFAHSSSNVYTRELLDHSNLRELFGI